MCFVYTVRRRRTISGTETVHRAARIDLRAARVVETGRPSQRGHTGESGRIARGIRTAASRPVPVGR